MDKSTNTVEANEALNKVMGAASDTLKNFQSSSFGKGLKRDWNAIKKAGVRTAESFGDTFEKKQMGAFDEKVSNLKEAGANIDEAAMRAAKSEAIGAGKKERSLEKIGGNLLEDLGRGNKVAGGAKLGAYMVGASMLTDLLNPFNDG